MTDMGSGLASTPRAAFISGNNSAGGTGDANTMQEETFTMDQNYV